MSPGLVTQLLLQYPYPFMVPAALLAGPLVGMLAGFFIRLGYLNFVLSYICLMAGELIGDIAWYWIGNRWGESFLRRWGKYVGIEGVHVEIAKRLFLTHNRSILFLSKLTTGLGLAIPILFTAGLSRVPFRRYMVTNVLGQFIWTGGLIAVGYFLGDYYLKVNSVFEKISTFSLILILFLCLLGFGKYVRARILEKYRNTSVDTHHI